MGGSTIQLLAYGAQDIYLTGTPQVTFFQAVYKRNTLFAMEFYKNQVSDSPGNGNTLRIPITRYGDLVGQMFFELPLLTSLVGTAYQTNNTTADLNWVAERAFESIEVQIGNNTIDKHYQTWWRLYSELFFDNAKKTQYAKLTTFTGQSASNPIVYLPLNFFFNCNPGLFLPLIALQYHEVQLVCTCAPNYATYFDTSKKPTLWVNYVLLDAEERRRFAAKQHEYLIEQVQRSTDVVQSGNRMRVNFQHPVKEIVWCYPNQSGTNRLWDFTVYPNFVNITCNPQNGIDIHTAGTPKLVAATSTWTESGDILYNTNTSNTIASFQNYNMAQTLYTSPMPPYANTQAVTTLRSNISTGALLAYNITPTNNSITYTITGNGVTNVNTFTLTNGLRSNAAVISDFAEKLKARMNTIPVTTFAPFRWSNLNAYVANHNHLVTTQGEHEISIQGIETSDLRNTFPMNLTFTGPGATLLGFNGYAYSNTSPLASVNGNLFGFSNTVGATYATGSNVTATNYPTFQFSYVTASFNNVIQTPPGFPQTASFTTSTAPTLIIDYIEASTSSYSTRPNTLSTSTLTFTTADQLRSNLQTAFNTIIKTNLGESGSAFFKYGNAAVAVDSSYNFSVNGIVGFSNTSVAPFGFDDASTINPLPQTSVAPLQSMTLYFNGQERFVHDAKFLNQLQPYYHHTGTVYPGVYVYSFALKPEEHQPTGTCNFSRLDNVEFVPNMKPLPAGSVTQNTNQVMFAVNYNVLRIKSGMAAVAFA